MFDILKLPAQDSHLQEFEALHSQAIADGNERDANHWQRMADMERRIASNGSQGENSEQSIPRRI